MKTKTFKIGEYCSGGIITVEIKKGIVAVIGKEWDHSKGTRRSSDQSGAKEFCRIEVNEDVADAQGILNEFILDLTTSYYAEQVMDYIKKSSKIKTSIW